MFRRVHEEPTYFKIYRIPEWMTPEQHRQVDAYVEGRAIPTDSEIVTAFRDCLDEQNTRSTAWAYGTVPGYLVGRFAYTHWCEFITETFDQDLTLDAGL